MGAWYYCSQCGNGGGQPSLPAIVKGEQACRHCGAVRPLSLDDRVSAAEAFEERLAEVEQKLEQMESL